MKDFVELKCPPYASTLQKRFATTEDGNDGYNVVLELAGFKLNKRPVDQENDTCLKCGCNGHTDKGKLLKWNGTNDLYCLKDYQSRYQKERYEQKKLEAK